MMQRAHTEPAPRRFRLVVPGVVAERPRALRFMTGICRVHALDADVEHALVSAFGEAFVVHRDDDGDGAVSVDVEVGAAAVVVQVRDRGHGQAAGADDEGERARRYGLFIMLRAMDEVRWHGDGDENVTVLVKRLLRRS